MALPAPTTANPGGYSPPDTVPILVTDSNIGKNLAFMQFTIYNTSSGTFSNQNLSINGGALTLVNAGEEDNIYLAFVPTSGITEGDSIALVTRVKCWYTDSTYTLYSTELYSITPPDAPVITNAIRLDANTGFVTINDPDSVYFPPDSSLAGVNYFLQYEGEGPVVDTGFISNEDATFEEGSIIYPIDNLPVGIAAHVSLQAVYAYNSVTYTSEVSNTAEFPDTPSPPSPQNLVAVLGLNYPETQPVVNLSWDPPLFPDLVTVDGYHVYRSTEPDGEYTLIGSTDDETFTFQDDEIDLDTTYYYYVTSYITSGGESLPSNTASVNVPALDPVTDVSAVLIEADEDGTAQITVTWVDSSNADVVPVEYVHVVQYIDGIMDTSMNVSYGVETATFSGLPTDVDVYYVITSVAYLNSTPSESATSNTVSIPKPGAVQNLVADYDLSLNIVTITWTRADNYDFVPPEYYDISISDVSGSVQISGEDLSYAFPEGTFLPGVEYTITVASIPYLMAEGYVPESASVDFFTSGPQPPEDVLSEYIDATGFVETTWSQPSSGPTPDTYDIYVDISSAGYVFLANVSGSTFDYVDTEVVNGNTYQYRIVSIFNDAPSDPAFGNLVGPVWRPASQPQDLLLAGYNETVYATFSHPANLYGATGLNYVLNMYTVVDGINTFLFTDSSIPYDLSNNPVVLEYAYPEYDISNNTTYRFEVQLITHYTGQSGNSDGLMSNLSNPAITGAPPIIDSFVIDDGQVQIVFTSNNELPNHVPYEPFSTAELIYPFPLVVGSADAGVAPITPLITFAPGSIPSGLSYEYVGSGIVGNQYSVTYSASNLLSPFNEVPITFAVFSAINRYGTTTQMEPDPAEDPTYALQNVEYSET